MSNATIIPDERIKCSPNCDAPSELRPGKPGWLIPPMPEGQRPIIDINVVPTDEQETPVLVEKLLVTGNINGFIVFYKRNEQQQDFETYSENGQPKAC